MGSDQVQCRLCTGHQGWGQGSGVTEGATGLQQGVAEIGITGQEGAAAAEGFAEGPTDQSHRFDAKAEAATLRSQYPEGMGFIHQQIGPKSLAHCSQSCHIRAGALHAEQAFAEHHHGSRLPCHGLQPPLEIRQIVVLEALQTGTAGPHAHQKRVVNQSIGQNRGVPVSQDADGSEVRLEATGKQQDAASSKPVGQVCLETRVTRPAAGDQP